MLQQIALNHYNSMPAMPAITNAPTINPSDFFLAFRRVCREWQQFLTSNEFSVVMFIFDRTYGWGKAQEDISMPQILDGFVDRAGRLVHGGVNMCKNTVRAVINSLKEKGLLIKEGYKCRLQINADISNMFKMPKPKTRLTPLEIIAFDEYTNKDNEQRTKTLEGDVILDCSELDRDGAEVAQPMGHLGGQTTGIGEQPPGYEYIEEDIEEDSELSPAAKADELRDVVKSIKDTHVKKAESAFDKAMSSKFLTKTQLDLVQLVAWKEQFSESPYLAPKQKDVSALFSYIKRWNAGQGNRSDSVTFGTFYYWCMTNWRMVISMCFSWMDSPPMFPSTLFLIKRSQEFEQMFARRKEMEARNTLPLSERMILELTDKGVSRETAELDVAERLKPRTIKSVKATVVEKANRNDRFILPSHRPQSQSSAVDYDAIGGMKFDYDSSVK